MDQTSNTIINEDGACSLDVVYFPPAAFLQLHWLQRRAAALPSTLTGTENQHIIIGIATFVQSVRQLAWLTWTKDTLFATDHQYHLQLNAANATLTFHSLWQSNIS